MSAIKTQRIEAALLKKGFRRDYTHHECFWLYVEGRQTSVKTRLSYGIREYGDDLLAQLKKQLGVSKPQLHALVGCPLTYDEYVAHLVGSGRIKTA